MHLPCPLIRALPRRRLSAALLALAAAAAAGCEQAWNNPYPLGDDDRSILYLPFSEDPKHFDPAVAYSSDEAEVIDNIYVFPLQYHYLNRPYELIPFAAESMPQVVRLDENGDALPPGASASEAAYTRYVIPLRKDMRYHPHPALAKGDSGEYLYHDLGEDDVGGVRTVFDFPAAGTRPVLAEDFVYQVKRLADPRVLSPIFGLMEQHIAGLGELRARLSQLADEGFDLRDHDIAGARAAGDHVLEITVRGSYPQFPYWLATHFFAPMPWEADAFYRQEPLVSRDVTLDRYPVGSGPYRLAEYRSNRRMVLERNDDYMQERYPQGAAQGADEGLLADAGSRLPLIERIVFIRETESIPYWNKFLQGYYDFSGITSDNFHEVVSFGPDGAELSEDMRARGLSMRTTVAPSVTYLGFNMADPVVGGDGERARKLRQALAIAVDFGEFIRIFRNERGREAHGPIPPAIFGGEITPDDYNDVVFDERDGEFSRKGISEAERLLAEAGYPGGRDEETGKQLVLNFDSTLSGPSAKPLVDWLDRQFAKLGVQLRFRTTDYNRFREKMRKGSSQIYIWGWNADYPDPENFLFLFHGPQSKVDSDGENASNYRNPEFDRLFGELSTARDDAERAGLVARMVAILRQDTPWIWGFHPVDFSLSHEWVSNVFPGPVLTNKVKYWRIEPEVRARRREEWNEPAILPLVAALGAVAALAFLGLRQYRRRDEEVVFGGPKSARAG